MIRSPILIAALAGIAGLVVPDVAKVTQAAEGPAADRQLAAAIPEGAALDSIAALATRLARIDRFAGVVLVAKDGAPLLENAYGAARRDPRQPVMASTRFNLSSVGKLFTRVAIQSLVDQGKMQLDAPIGTYWPDYPDADARRQVTVRELIEHKSGLGGDIFGPGDARFAANHDYLNMFIHEPLAFTPGSRAEYSNAGYVLLGELIERVAGVPYETYVQQHIFAPAGMTHTGFLLRAALPPDAAIGYTTGDDVAGPEDSAPETPPGPLHDNTETLPGRGSAAGGSYSTGADLLRFDNAIRAGTLHDVVGPHDLSRALGGSPGSNAAVFRNLPGGYDVIVLANVDPPAARTIAASAALWLSGMPTR